LEAYLAAAAVMLGFSTLAATPGLWCAYRANRTFRAYSRRMRRLVDSAQEGVICLDGRSLIAYVNPAALRLLGDYSLEKLLGLPLHETLHHSLPDGRPHLQENCPLCQARARGESIQCDCYFLRKDGAGIDIEASLAPILDADASFAWLIFFKDITESRNMRALTQAVYQSSADAHAVWQDGRLVECSPSALHLFKVASSQELAEKMLNQQL
jgi:PAS domain S-box-containing protein